MTELSLRGDCDKYTPQRGNDLGTEAKVGQQPVVE